MGTVYLKDQECYLCGASTPCKCIDCGKYICADCAYKPEVFDFGLWRMWCRVCVINAYGGVKAIEKFADELRADAEAEKHAALIRKLQAITLAFRQAYKPEEGGA